ncbi:uncharacterized protein LOC143123425 [Alosa pseudoharengus]|uniref:uncharacterized protein LOC143123425 n=1 Tax=Alosa pseudoharengus TaxID=34774 RepID=UPI003F8C9A7F
MQKLTGDTLSFASSPEGLKLQHTDWYQRDVRSKIMDESGQQQHVDMMSHKQACIDLEKATQFITQVLQTVVLLRNELRDLCQQLQTQQRKERVLQEGQEWLQGVERQLQVKSQMVSPEGQKLFEAPVSCNKEEEAEEEENEEEEEEDYGHGESSQSVTLEITDPRSELFQTQQEPCGGLVLAVKEEDGESGYGERRGSDKECIVEESALRAEYPVSSAEDIKTEQVQEEEDESHLAPVFSSEAASSTLSLADPLHLVQLSRVSVKLVDCCRTGQHGTEKNRDGEQQKRLKRTGLCTSSSMAPSESPTSSLTLQKEPKESGRLSRPLMDTGVQDIVPLTSCSLPVVLELDTGVQDIVPLTSCSLPAVLGLDTGVQDIVPLTSCSLPVVLELDTGVQDIVPLTSCSLSVVLELDTGVQDIVPLTSCSLPAVLGLDTGIQDIVPFTSCSLSVVLGLDTGIQDIVPLTSCSLPAVLGMDTVMLNAILCSSCCLGTGGSKSSAHPSDSAGMQTSVIAVTRGSS